MADVSAVVIRPLTEADLVDADRVFRVAFGTFLGAPDPRQFFGDAEFVRTRWHTDNDAAFAAVRDGRLVGSNFVTNWGSVGFFGPLTVDPACWNQGIAKLLMEPTVELFDSWGTRHAGLFTFSQSAMHVGLYQRFGFWPRFLTAVMSRPVGPPAPAQPGTRMSDLAGTARPGALASVRELTDAVYPGLDLTREIEAVLGQGLGDVVLIDDTAALQGVAICHIGAGTEAGGGNCYVKFGAVRPAVGRLLPAGRRQGRRRARGRRERRPGQGLEGPRAAWIPRRHAGSDHAPAERLGLQPQRQLRHRRLALAPGVTCEPCRLTRRPEPCPLTWPAGSRPPGSVTPATRWPPGASCARRRGCG
jgi:GNAT superfamily N-acetyltransferase